MDRRDLLGAFAGSALMVGSTEPAAAAARAEVQVRRRPAHLQMADGAELYVRQWGPDSGPVLLFMSSWAMNSDMWSYQMADLCERGFRCVAYDRRGHGRSSDPGTGYDYDTLSDDLAAVIAQLKLDHAVLVGHSFASGEMVRHATRHGSKHVTGLFFLSPASTPFTLKTPDNPNGIDGALLDGFRRQYLLKDYPNWLAENARAFVLPETSQAMMDWAKSLMLQASMKALYELNKIGTSTDFRPELKRIRIPAIVVHGTKDASAPIDITGRPTAEMIPGARLKVIEGAPHGLFLTHRERITDEIAEFATA